MHVDWEWLGDSDTSDLISPFSLPSYQLDRESLRFLFLLSAGGTVSQTVRAPSLRTHHFRQEPGPGFPMCVTSLTLAFVSFFYQLAQPFKFLLQFLACIHNFQNNSILLQILLLTSSCQKICMWKCRNLCWITLRDLLAFSKKATSYRKEKFTATELCRLFPNMSYLSICSLTMPVSSSVCQFLFICREQMCHLSVRDSLAASQEAFLVSQLPPSSPHVPCCTQTPRWFAATQQM